MLRCNHSISLKANPRMDNREHDLKSDSLVFCVLLFASLKDAVGRDRISVHVPIANAVEPDTRRQSVSWSELLRCCAEQHPPLAPWLPYVKAAVNREYADAGVLVSPSDEIALLPPVSGGAPV